MFNVRVRAHTPVGAFSGYLSATPASREACASAINDVQKIVLNAAYLGLYGKSGEEIILPEAVLQKSVLTFEIEHVGTCA